MSHLARLEPHRDLPDAEVAQLAVGRRVALEHEALASVEDGPQLRFDVLPLLLVEDIEQGAAERLLPQETLVALLPLPVPRDDHPRPVHHVEADRERVDDLSREADLPLEGLRPLHHRGLEPLRVGADASDELVVPESQRELPADGRERSRVLVGKAVGLPRDDRQNAQGSLPVPDRRPAEPVAGGLDLELQQRGLHGAGGARSRDQLLSHRGLGLRGDSAQLQASRADDADRRHLELELARDRGRREVVGILGLEVRGQEHPDLVDRLEPLVGALERPPLGPLAQVKLHAKPQLLGLEGPLEKIVRARR